MVAGVEQFAGAVTQQLVQSDLNLKTGHFWPHILFSTPSHHSCMASLTTPITKSLLKTSVGSLAPSPRLGLLVSCSVMISTAELKHRNQSVNGKIN